MMTAPIATPPGVKPIANQQGEIRHEIYNVSPEMAISWLEQNNRNRKLRKAVVSRYARDMSRGLWKFNGEPIQFDTNGDLINGQHRLNAVRESRTTQPFLVVTGLPPEAHESLDAGAKRTAGDVLTLAGYEDGKTIGATARLALNLDANPNVARETRGWSTAEIKARVDSDPELLQIVNEVMPALPRALFTILPRSVIGYALYRLSKIAPEQAMEFFTSLGTGANLPAESPILALARRLNVQNQRPKGPQSQYESLAYIFMAWNAWRKGEPRSIIKLSHTVDGRIRLVPPV